MRKELGEAFDSEIDKRLSAITGDVGTDALGLDAEGKEALSTCDVVIHSAATVSFESPIDLAVEVNLLGPSRVAAAIAESGSKAHLIAVSTAYVAGSRRGDAKEELITESWYSPDVDWRAEVTAGRRALADAENDSRQVRRLGQFQKQARHELGAAGKPLIAERSEKIRQEWVRQQLVDLGKARGQSLGYPDVYAFTKALGERALLEQRGSIPVSFVRPSIIESALQEPTPGWIRGFRMAEPILIGVGKGLLKSFPGLPEGVLDVIPVDKVVSTILAVAATEAPKDPKVYQIASGSRQPLKYRELVALVTDWYHEHPLYDTDGNPIIVPEWTYPSRGKVQRRLNQAVTILEATEKTLHKLPLRRGASEFTSKLEERRLLAERARGYVEIYSAYTESEASFQINKTLELFESLPETDKEKFSIDPIDIDWRAYLHEIHLPSVISQGRVRTKPTQRTPIDRVSRTRARVLAPERQLAVFDFENTLVKSNIAENYAWLATRRLNTAEQAGLLAKKLPKAPSMWMLDKKDRGDFQRTFYRWYKDAPVDELTADARELMLTFLLGKSFPEGLRRVQEHKEAGHKTMLITGALDIIVEPLRPLFDHIAASKLVERDGVFTGELATPPPVGEARALLLRDYAEDNNIDLAETVAYADSVSDLPMLEVVGHPVAVNPEVRLASVARRRGWTVERWRRDAGSPIEAESITEKR